MPNLTGDLVLAPAGSSLHVASVDGAVVADKGLKLGPGTYVVQVGKRKFARVTLA